MTVHGIPARVETPAPSIRWLVRWAQYTGRREMLLLLFELFLFQLALALLVPVILHALLVFFAQLQLCCELLLQSLQLGGLRRNLPSQTIVSPSVLRRLGPTSRTTP